MPDVGVISGSILSPGLFDSRVLVNADVLIIRDVADPDLLPIVAARRRRRKLSVYEITRHLFADLRVGAFELLDELPDSVGRRRRGGLDEPCRESGDGLVAAADQARRGQPHVEAGEGVATTHIRGGRDALREAFLQPRRQVPIPRLPGQDFARRSVIVIRDSVVSLVDGYGDYGS